MIYILRFFVFCFFPFLVDGRRRKMLAEVYFVLEFSVG